MVNQRALLAIEAAQFILPEPIIELLDFKNTDIRDVVRAIALTIKVTIEFAAVLMFLLILVPGVSELVGGWQELQRRQETVQEAQSWQEVGSNDLQIIE